MSDYAAFLDSKAQLGGDFGFSPTFMPDSAFDFQASLIEWAVLKGRAAIFADCGLGKTLMELAWAENVRRHTGGNVLILTCLAVAAQMEAEAEKFGIAAKRSSDGTAFGITITNYERLHLFNANDFAGVVCDECFAAGTLVDMADGSRKRIENIREGDRIKNASGIDLVSDVHRREVPYAILVNAETGPIIVSPNHPFFTERGWVAAQDIEPTDALVATNAAMRMVRDELYPNDADRTFLRAVLLSEMADAPAGTSGESPFAGSSSEARSGEGRVVSRRQHRRAKGIGADHGAKSHQRPGRSREDIPHIESHEPRTFRAWGQWQGHDGAAILDDGRARAVMGGGACYITGSTSSGVSDMLQARLSERRAQSRYRGGWSFSRGEASLRSEEGRMPGRVRLEGIEILEPSDPRLDQSRDANGKLYFYDLGGTRHPSFSVGGALVHNSSILKNFAGSRKQDITAFMRKRPYRLLATATAAPNDYVELGTSSEALGHLGYIDMLNRFFKNDLNNSAQGRMRGEVIKWRLKGHAETPFWRWVCSWARAVRRPSDLGFSDDRFALPPLVEREHIVRARTLADGALFALPAHGLAEQRDERRRTIAERCEMAASIANATTAPVLLWCHLNDEGDTLEKAIPDAVQVSGSDSDDVKEDRLLGFASGKYRTLICKPKIGAWGLNYQHCAHEIYFPSHSFEQYYQSIRRCWRFGQTRSVEVDLIASEGEVGILANMQRKAAQADAMFAALVAEMNNAMGVERSKVRANAITLPAWI